jgi:hypothetical protein
MKLVARVEDPIIRIETRLAPDECVDRLHETFDRADAAAAASPGVPQLAGKVDDDRMTVRAGIHLVAPRGKRVDPGRKATYTGRLEGNDAGSTLMGTVSGNPNLWRLLLIGLFAAPIVQVVSLLPWPLIESTWPATWSRPGAVLLVAAPLELLFVRQALGSLLSRALSAHAIAAELAATLHAAEPTVEFRGGRLEAVLLKWGMPLIHLWVLAASAWAIAVAATAPSWWTGGIGAYVSGRSQAMLIGALCALGAAWFLGSYLRALCRLRTAAH